MKNDLFDMGINNEVYFIPSQYNNYHTIQISDSEYDQVYFWVGNQGIYAVNTYFIGGKQKVGYRTTMIKNETPILNWLIPPFFQFQLLKDKQPFSVHQH